MRVYKGDLGLASLGMGAPVVIVDGYFLSGNLLAPALHQRGTEVVHLKSSEEFPEGVGSSFRPNDYHSHLVHEGRYSTTLNNVRRHNPAAVIAGAESGVILADRISEDLGLITNGTRQSQERRDKRAMGLRLSNLGLRDLSQTAVKTEKEAIQWVKKHGKWPIAVKPPTGSGTINVRISSSLDDVLEAFHAIINKRNDLLLINDVVVLEEYILGTEYAFNAVSSYGRHFVTDIWRYERHEARGAATIYDHDTLIPFTDPVVAFLLPYALQCLDALGIKHGPSHLEIKVHDTKPTIVEGAARLCGAGLPRVAALATNRNAVELTLDAYLNPKRFETLEQGYQMLSHAMVIFLQGKGIGTVSHQCLPLLNCFAAFHAANIRDEGSQTRLTIDGDTVLGIVELLHDDPQTIKLMCKSIRFWEKWGLFENVG